MNAADTPAHTLNGKGSFGTIALAAGAAGLALCALGYATDPGQFFPAWLTAFAYWMTMALGALFFVMLHHVTGAVWSVVIRRVAEAMTAALPVLAVLFLPVLFGAHTLYEWTHHEEVAKDALLTHKAPYLNLGFFAIRAAVYFAVWIVLSMLLTRRSLRQDADRDPAHTVVMKKTSAVGMFFYAFSVTFAAFDWYMSTQPHWYSTIYGVFAFAAGFVSLLAFLTVFLLRLRRRGALADVVGMEHYHDLGRMLFAFVVFWAYIGGSQFFLIWYANIPEETIWYAMRWDGEWRFISLALLFLHFAVPFITLAFYGMKRNLAVLGTIAGLIVFMHYVTMYWLVMPMFSRPGVGFSWMHIAAMLGIGGVVLWQFHRRFAAHSPVASGDPHFQDSVAHRV